MLLAPIMAGHNATDDDGGAAGAVRVSASNEEKDELKRRRSIVVDFVSVFCICMVEFVARGPRAVSSVLTVKIRT